MLCSGPGTSLTTGPKNSVMELPPQETRVNHHDPDQEEQTADLARDEILPRYPQVKP